MRPCAGTRVTKSEFYSAEPNIFLQRHPTHGIRLDFDAIASAIELYIILHKLHENCIILYHIHEKYIILYYKAAGMV